jgi:hypothetical protein
VIARFLSGSRNRNPLMLLEFSVQAFGSDAEETP